MYQEAGRIEPTLRDAVATAESWGLETEILPVDDGSTDGTRDLVDRLARELPCPHSPCTIRPLRHHRNRGKGAAVRTGLAAARSDWVLMMDADNSARLAELPKLAEAAERTGAALTVGSRAAPDADS